MDLFCNGHQYVLSILCFNENQYCLDGVWGLVILFGPNHNFLFLFPSWRPPSNYCLCVAQHTAADAAAIQHIPSAFGVDAHLVRLWCKYYWNHRRDFMLDTEMQVHIIVILSLWYVLQIYFWQVLHCFEIRYGLFTCANWLGIMKNDSCLVPKTRVVWCNFFRKALLRTWLCR